MFFDSATHTNLSIKVIAEATLCGAAPHQPPHLSLWGCFPHFNFSYLLFKSHLASSHVPSKLRVIIIHSLLVSLHLFAVNKKSVEGCIKK